MKNYLPRHYTEASSKIEFMALRKPRASTIGNDPILQYWVFPIVESQGISLCQKPIFELTSV